MRLPFRQVGRRFELPADLHRQGAKLVILANPNNPSATLIPVERAAAPLRRRRRHGDGGGRRGLRRFRAGRRARRQHAASSRRAPNLVVLRTFSKSYSLAGARLGLLFAAAPVVAALTKVKDSYNVNAITQALGVGGARGPRAISKRAIRRTLAERARLEAALGEARVFLARIGGQLPARRDRRPRRGDLPRPEGPGTAGALVEHARAAHEDPLLRRQPRGQQPSHLHAREGGLTRPWPPLASATWKSPTRGSNGTGSASSPFAAPRWLGGGPTSASGRRPWCRPGRSFRS